LNLFFGLNFGFDRFIVLDEGGEKRLGGRGRFEEINY